MPFEWFIALRYLREGRMQTALILGAVSIGVGVLVFLSALMGGLETSLIDKTLGSQAHVVVHPPDEEARVIEVRKDGEVISAHVEKPSQHPQSIAAFRPLVAQIAGVPGVVAVSPAVTGPAFVVRGAATKSILLRGMEPESYARIIDLPSKMRAGRWDVTGTEVLLGTDLARELGVTVGDKIRIVAADGQSDVVIIAGIFDLGSKDANMRVVLTALRAAQTLFDLGGGVSAIDVKVRDVFTAEKAAVDIEERTSLVADSWMKTNPQLLVALGSQARSANVMQFFITLTVALGIASVLIVSVVQKSREIGVMRAVGTPAKRVLRVFLIQGGLVGFGGSILGSGLGAALAMLFVNLERTADGAPMFPLQLTGVLFVVPIVLATLVGIGAAVAPARRAARLDPAEVIRYG